MVKIALLLYCLIVAVLDADNHQFQEGIFVRLLIVYIWGVVVWWLESHKTNILQNHKTNKL